MTEKDAVWWANYEALKRYQRSDIASHRNPKNLHFNHCKFYNRDDNGPWAMVGR